MIFKGQRYIRSLCILLLCLMCFNQNAQAETIEEPTATETESVMVTAEEPTEIVVTYKPSVPHDLAGFLYLADIQSRTAISEDMAILTISDTIDPDQFLTQLRQEATVLTADINGELMVMDIPNDPDYASQWALKAIGLENLWPTTSLNSIGIAIIDSGVDCTHEEFVGQLLPGYDYVTQSTTVTDVSGHGTEVAGCFAATSNNAIGLAGYASNNTLKIAPYRVGGTSVFNTGLNLAYACAAIRAAAERTDVQILNLSFGTTYGFDSLESAVAFAVEQGKIVVASSGNISSTVSAGAFMFPAVYEGVIAVGATTETQTLAAFSQYNAAVDLVAPGANILTTQMSNGYGTHSGTSFAAPMVSGGIGLLLSKNPELSTEEIVHALTLTAVDLGEAGKDYYYGNGLIQIDRAESAIPETGNVVYGDVNENAQINSEDALIVLKQAVQLIGLEDAALLRSDVSKDNAINSEDALQILKYAVGIINYF